MAAEIIFNAKTQRIGVCNACESLVIHENIIEKALPAIKAKLDEKMLLFAVMKKQEQFALILKRRVRKISAQNILITLSVLKQFLHLMKR